MTHQPQNPAIVQELLAQADWVRSLALQLVRDPHTAEDLAQETMVSALEAPPVELTHARGWLGTVLHNLVKSRFRAESRRSSREQHAAQREALPSTAKLVERAHLQRELVGRVLELDERYREVLLLRFFESLPPRFIAMRLGLPVDTVRTRLERGLAALREKLDRDHEGREKWLTAFTPLITPWAPAAPIGALPGAAKATTLRLGVILVNAKYLATAAVIVLALVTAELWPKSGPLPIATVDLESQTLAETSPAPEPVLQGNSPAPARTPASPAPSASKPPATPDELTLIHGLAVDETGKPLGGVRLRLSTTELDRALETFARLPHMREVRGTLPEDEAAALAAYESDPDATLEAGGLSALKRAWVAYLEDNSGAPPTIETHADGRFELLTPNLEHLSSGSAQLPISPPRFVSLADGLAVIGGGQPTAPSQQAQHVVLLAQCGHLSGYVEDPSGAPLEDVKLIVPTSVGLLRGLSINLKETWSAGFSPRATTGPDGAFRFQNAPFIEGMDLFATKAGYEEEHVSLSAGSQSGLTVVLSPTPRNQLPTLHGHIITFDGVPAEGAQVAYRGNSLRTKADGAFEFELSSRLNDEDPIVAAKSGARAAILDGAQVLAGADEELFLRLGPAPLQIEGVLAIDKEKAPHQWMVNLFGTTSLGWSSTSLEARSSTLPASHGTFGERELDTRGGFAFGGLQDKNYTLHFWNSQTGESFDVGPLPAGSQGLQLEPPTLHLIASIQGQVVDSQGQPVSGARVDLSQVVGFMNSEPVRQGLLTATTDAQGRYEFRDVPDATWTYRVTGDNVMPIGQSSLPAPFDPGPHRLEVECRWTFVLKTTSVEPANRFRIVDAEGKPLTLIWKHQGGSSYTSQSSIEAAATGRFETSDRAAELIIFAGEEELRRIPVTPKLGAVQTLVL